MSIPSKFKFDFSKFPEGGLLMLIVVLGLVLAVFGGLVQMPKFETAPGGKSERGMMTNAVGQQVPAFEKANKFFNAKALVQIAKDTSFFAIMAVGMTFVIITGGIALFLGSMYAFAALCGAPGVSPHCPSGGGVATVLRGIATICVAALPWAF